VEEIARERLVQRDAVLVLAVKPRGLVLVEVLRQCDGGQQRQGILVDSVEMWPQSIQKVFRIIGVALPDKLQVGVDEDGP
jgi:hypothetical protein